MTATLPEFEQVIYADFEFVAKPGEPPDVVCLAWREEPSGQTYRLWRDQLGDTPPYRTDARVLFVCGVGWRLHFNAYEIDQPTPELFAVYWRWSDDWLAHALDTGVMWTPFGWTCRPGTPSSTRAQFAIFPSRATAPTFCGSCISGTPPRAAAAGSTVHVAVLNPDPIEPIEVDVALMQRSCAGLSRVVLGGHELPPDTRSFATRLAIPTPRRRRLGGTCSILLRCVAREQYHAKRQGTPTERGGGREPDLARRQRLDAEIEAEFRGWWPRPRRGPEETRAAGWWGSRCAFLADVCRLDRRGPRPWWWRTDLPARVCLRPPDGDLVRR